MASVCFTHRHEYIDTGKEWLRLIIEWKWNSAASRAKKDCGSSFSCLWALLLWTHSMANGGEWTWAGVCLPHFLLLGKWSFLGSRIEWVRLRGGRRGERVLKELSLFLFDEESVWEWDCAPRAFKWSSTFRQEEEGEEEEDAGDPKSWAIFSSHFQWHGMPMHSWLGNEEARGMCMAHHHEDDDGGISPILNPFFFWFFKGYMMMIMLTS